MRSTKSKTKPKADAAHTLSFEAIGTVWDIAFYGHAPSAQITQEIRDRTNLFDATYSRFRADSFVCKIARAPGLYPLPEDAWPMLDFYKRLYKLTQGAMTPLIGSVLSDAGYDESYSLQPKQLRMPPSWESALTYTASAITIKKPTLLDFGAAGKGYLVDIISDLLVDAGHEPFVINAGGDILAHNLAAPLRIGLEHPDDPSKAIGVASLSAQSICGSAGNRRKWAGFTHIIDPRTLQSPTHIAAVWVVAGSTMLADGLATALYFAEPGTLAGEYTFEYAILHHDYSLEKSAGFPAKFFTSTEP